MDILVFWKVHKNGDRAGIRKAGAGFGDTNRSRTIPTGNLGGTDDCVCFAAGRDQKQHVPRLESRSPHLQDIAVAGRDRRDAEAKNLFAASSETFDDPPPMSANNICLVRSRADLARSSTS